MTLLSARKEFVKKSGRYDLVADWAGADYTDNGANYFIQQGQRWLDRKYRGRKSYSRVFEELAIGSWYCKFQYARAIQEVWANDSDSRVLLERKSLSWLKENYASLISDTDSGNTAYWCPARLRGTDITDMDAQGAFFNYVVADTDDYQGIIVLPPPDEAIVVEAYGLFHLDTLSADDDENYWTQEEPWILVMSALRMLEVSYRNSSGVRDWEQAIASDLAELDKDSVEEDIYGVDQMEG
jgi:hypothetical protein